MDTFGGKPTKGEGIAFVIFYGILLVGLGFVGGLILCSM